MERANKNSKEIKFKIGDKVFKQVAKTARGKNTDPKYIGPYTIVRIHPNNIMEKYGENI